MARPFSQVDVFSSDAYRGNPVAVVHDADGLTTQQMQAFAVWTNLSETTFLLAPTRSGADYRVRIFTPVLELPFAGHPTLGSAHAWLARAGQFAGNVVTQECGAGLIPIRRGERLAFAAPPLVHFGPLAESVVDSIVEACDLDRREVLDAAWVDNGPGWVAVRLSTVERVLAVRPRPVDLDFGLVALYPPGGPVALEVRAFFPKDGVSVEDPVTGSLNASVAQWLLESGHLTAPYVASQGGALGRTGRIEITQDGDGTIWVGGATVTRISGEVDL